MTLHTDPHDLVAFADGSLSADERPLVERHLAGCEECTSWLAAYSMVEEISVGQTRRHPESETIAGFAVDRAHVPVQERAGLAAHLEACEPCGREYRLTKEALDAARRAVEPATRREALVFPGARPATGWVAAGALAATVALVVLWIPHPISEPTTLSNALIEDRRVVHSHTRLVASNVQLTDSSELELRAEQGVVLGEGFSVERGARLRIGNRVPASPRNHDRK